MITLNEFFDEIENMKEDIFIYRDEKISVIFDKLNGLKILNLNYSDDKNVLTEKLQQRRRNIYILKEHKNNKKKRK